MTLTAQCIFFWVLMLVDPGKVSFIVTHINDVDNMRLDWAWSRENGKGQGRAEQGVQKRRRGRGWIGRDVDDKYTNKGNGRLCSYGQA